MTAPAQQRLTADSAVIRTWLTHLYAGHPGYISVCSDGDRWVGRRFATDEAGLDAATAYAAQLDRRRPRGIYTQVTTLSEQPTEGRGGEDLAHVVTHLWADGDFGTIGHKPGLDDLDAPPDAEAVQKVVEESGLPAPSGWTLSGGGYNPVWMLADPRVMSDAAERARVKEITTAWQAILAAQAYRLGWSWDIGVGNLDRLMKLPGSVNRKEGLERPTAVGPGNGLLYDFAALESAALRLVAAARETLAQADQEKKQREADRLGRKVLPPRPPRAERTGQRSGDGPLDVLADTMEFRDILEPAGWTYQGQRRDGREAWLRPTAGGDAPSSEYSLLCDGHVAINWSERSGLPVGAQPPGGKLTVGKVYAHLNYGGNTSEAARDIMRAAGGHQAGPAARLPRTALDEAKRRCLANSTFSRNDEAELRALIASNDGPPIDWSDTELGEPDGAHVEKPAAPSRRPGLLPEEFWQSRADLRHIRQAGHSRNRSGDVAFYSSLARLSAMVPHHIKADTGVADFVSLNLFVALVGPSGAGKTSGVRAASRLMPAPPDLDFRDGLPIGSGEGIAEVFMGTTEEYTGEIHKGGPKKGDPVTVPVRAQVRHNAFFNLDEGATLTRLMKERSGSTLGETLRSAAVGQTLGQTNASKETSRYIPGGSYSLGMLIGFQPETAAPLMEDVAEGTPQRFLWGVVNDPSIPDVQPEWPGELTAWRKVMSVSEPTLITFDRAISEELRKTDLANARGEVPPEAVNPLDSHAPLMRIKVASLLAVLGGRLHVVAQDWELAATVWRASCQARDAVVRYSEQQRRADQEKRTQARIFEEVRVEQAKTSAEEARVEKAVERIATRIAGLVRDAGPLSRSAMRTKFAGRDKKHMGDAIAYGVLREWVIERDGKVASGAVEPS